MVPPNKRLKLTARAGKIHARLQLKRRVVQTWPYLEMTGSRRAGLIVVLSTLCAAGVAYHVLDLREPRHTRAVMDAFRRGERGAWDDYKMDPPRSKRAVPALLEGMQDPNPTVRERAVVGVCGLSRDASVLTALRDLSGDSDRFVREAARRCLKYTYHLPHDGL